MASTSTLFKAEAKTPPRSDLQRKFEESTFQFFVTDDVEAKEERKETLMSICMKAAEADADVIIASVPGLIANYKDLDETFREDWEKTPELMGCSIHVKHINTSVKNKTLKSHVYVLNIESTLDQRRVKPEKCSELPMISDPELKLADPLDLHTCEFKGTKRYSRMNTLIKVKMDKSNPDQRKVMILSMEKIPVALGFLPNGKKGVNDETAAELTTNLINASSKPVIAVDASGISSDSTSSLSFRKS